jgi:hypothetical protein
MHVPKTAGTSLHAALAQALPPGSVSPRRMDASAFSGFQDFDAIDSPARSEIAASAEEIAEMAGYAVVSGHFALPTLRSISPPEAIATILREPRARTASLYAFYRTPGIFFGYLPYSLGDYALRSFEDFLGEPRVSGVVDNQVCRMLLDGDPRIPRAGFIADHDVDALAAEAIAALDTLAFTGVLEWPLHAWEGFSRLFGVELHPGRLMVTGDAVKPVRWSTEQAGVSDLARELLERRNAVDRLIYDHALELGGLDEDQRHRFAQAALERQLERITDLLCAEPGGPAPLDWPPAGGGEIIVTAQSSGRPSGRGRLARHRRPRHG